MGGGFGLRLTVDERTRTLARLQLGPPTRRTLPALLLCGERLPELDRGCFRIFTAILREAVVCSIVPVHGTQVLRGIATLERHGLIIVGEVQVIVGGTEDRFWSGRWMIAIRGGVAGGYLT